MKMSLPVQKSNVLLAIISIFAALFIAELLLRCLDANAERKGKERVLQYRSAYTHWEHKLLELRPPNRTIAERKEEFTHVLHTNSLGFNDREWPLLKDSLCRIACLGDSYTEGYGASDDSSYPQILQTLLKSTEVMKCGMQGCDPLYEYFLLKKKLGDYKPDVVTLTINSTDLDDVIAKGGFERFSEDGMVREKKRPWWEFFFQHSYVVRLIGRNGLKLDYLLMTKRQHQLAFKNATETLEQCLDKFHSFCADKNIRCVFVFNPGRHEVERGDLDCEQIMKYAESKGYETINGLAYFQNHGANAENINRYFWKLDGHNNNTGYRLLAEAIASHFTAASSKDVCH